MQRSAAADADPIRVLFVDDEPAIVSLAATVLGGIDGFVVETETSAAAALDHLDDASVDCIVSDYRMPGTDGLELLATVRDSHPKLPFILSTGKGSEEAASEAISMGVTDYLRKGGGVDQYELLANRVENAVGQRRAEKALAERERRLERQRDELARLDRINVVIQGIIRGLVGAATREEIERTVCERIAASDLYGVAWIAERDETGGLAVETGAGVEDIAAVATDGGLADPGVRALETGTVQVVEEPSPSMADAHGSSGPMAMVPLSYREVVYGVLGLSATHPDAFAERERAGLTVLGEVAGFAISAAQNMKLLLSDTAVAVTLRLTDDTAFPVAVTDRLDCRYSLDGMVPAADDTVLQYVTIEGTPPESVLDLAETFPGIVEARLVSGGEEDGLFEFATTEGPADIAIDMGGTVRRLTAEDGEARLVCEVAADTDVRRVVDAFEAAYPGTAFLSKRAVELPVGTEAGFRQAVDDRLTEKQRAAVRAAFFAGYYDWPRGSTAEELAASMGISSPTLHSHLRKAQRKLLTAFLDDEG